MQTHGPSDLLVGLAERRKQLKMTLPVLVKRCGLPRATVCRMLKGNDRASFQHIVALAEALGVRILFQAEAAEAILEKQADRQARRIAKLVQANMALESQAVDAGVIAEMIDKTKSTLLSRLKSKELWYE